MTYTIMIFERTARHVIFRLSVQDTLVGSGTNNTLTMHPDEFDHFSQALNAEVKS